MKDWNVKVVQAISIAVVVVVALIGITVFVVTDSNNRRALEERKLQESTRKQQAHEALEAAKVKAALDATKAELDSKKRKLWERSTKSDENADANQ